MRHVSEMLLLDDLVKDEWGPEHTEFKSLLKLMLRMDPKERPSASECLAHPFFVG